MGAESRPGEKGFTLLLFLISVFVLVTAYTISGFSSNTSPGVFPMLTGTLMLLSSSVLLASNFSKRAGGRSFRESYRIVSREIITPKILIFSGIIVLYMVSLVPLHFLPSSFLFLTGSMVYFRGIKFLKHAMLISASVLLTVYLIFSYLFRIVLP